MSQFKQLLGELDLNDDYVKLFIDAIILDKPNYNSQAELLSIKLQLQTLPAFLAYVALTAALKKYFTLDIELLLTLDNQDSDILVIQDYLNDFLKDTELAREVFVADYQQGYVLQVFDIRILDILEDKLNSIQLYFKNIGIDKSFIAEFKISVISEVVYRDNKKQKAKDGYSMKYASYKELTIAQVEAPKKFVPTKKTDDAADGVFIENDWSKNDIYIEGFFFDSETFSSAGNKMTQIFHICQPPLTIKAVNLLTKYRTMVDVKSTSYGKVYGNIEFSERFQEYELRVEHVEMLDEFFIVKDKSEKPRFEFHAHTNMSEMDGICSSALMIETAFKMGLAGITITDHGSVQAFPEIQKTYGDILKNNPDTNFKVAYGLETSFVNKDDNVYNFSSNENLKEATYVVLDL